MFPKAKVFEEMSQVIGGTCTYSAANFDDAMDDAFYNLLHASGELYTAEEVGEQYMEKAEAFRESNPNWEDEFIAHLAQVEQECCEECGWWSYPGDSPCDCNEDEDEDDY